LKGLAVCRTLLVGNKSDLPRVASDDLELVAVSATTGEGIETLRDRLRKTIQAGPSNRNPASSPASAMSNSCVRAPKPSKKPSKP